MYLYFVASEELPRVKIGYASYLAQRLSHLRMSSCTPLYVLGAVWFDDQENVEKEEKLLHTRFYQLRLHGEWFRLTPELYSEIVRYIIKSDDSEVYQKTKFCRCGSPILEFEKACIHCYSKKGGRDILADLGFDARVVPGVKKLRGMKEDLLYSRCRCGTTKFTWRRFCDPCFASGKR